MNSSRRSFMKSIVAVAVAPLAVVAAESLPALRVGCDFSNGPDRTAIAMRFNVPPHIVGVYSLLLYGEIVSLEMLRVLRDDLCKEVALAADRLSGLSRARLKGKTPPAIMLERMGNNDRLG